MCHASTATPPEVPEDLRPPAAGCAGSPLLLTSDDGTQIAGYAAPVPDSTVGVVIAPDTRGLHPFYHALADRFAGLGVSAVAFDYYGRSAGHGERTDVFEYTKHDDVNTGPEIYADLNAALRHLHATTTARSVFVVGFCKGGRLAFHCAAAYPELAGVIGFYGTPAARRRNDALGAPIEQVDRMRVPVLGFFGGADPGIPGEVVDAFGRELTRAGVHRYIHTYPGAPHSFFDRSSAAHLDHCQDAWRRMIGFLRSGDPNRRS